GSFVRIDVSDVERVDVAALDRAIRDAGMFATSMELGGLAHFRLEVELNHYCCEPCQRGLVEGVSLLPRHRASGHFVWLDSARVDSENKSVVLFPRYNQTVDLVELENALHRLGFEPKAIRIKYGDQG